MPLHSPSGKRYHGAVTLDAASPPLGVPPTRLPSAGDASTLYLIDLSGYVFRAYHALPPLSNSQGEVTHAVHGTLSMLLRLLAQTRPAYLAVVADSVGPSFRQQLYAEYKANRPPPPADLSLQMQRVLQLVERLGMTVFKTDRMEADDLIATLVQHARQQAWQVVIVSADKDLLQLVDEGVMMFDPMRQKVFGIDETRAKMGVEPRQVGDLLALTGDTSDNIPGVPSVGPKTAAELLRSWGDLAGIYANLAAIPRAALRGKLAEHRDRVQLSRQLVALRSDLPIDWQPERLRLGALDADAARPLLEELEMQRLLERLPPVQQSETPSVPQPPPMPVRIETLTDEQGIVALAARLRTQSEVALAICLEAGTARRRSLRGLALCCAATEAYFVPQELAQSPAAAALWTLLEGTSIAKLCGDSKEDRSVLADAGHGLAGVAFDVPLASYLLDAGRQEHSVEAVAQRELQELLPLAPSELAAPEELAAYAGQRASAVWRLAKSLRPRLLAAGLAALLVELELPLAAVLATMEQYGVRLDLACLAELASTVGKQLIELEQRCKELAGTEFNVASPRQLESILFDKLGLPVLKRTKTARSTDHEVLQELAALHELPAAILEQRALAKLKSTYLDALPREVDPRTSRLHSRYNQTVASTGRLSSSEPNVQNIPIRSELGRTIRKAFVPEPGWRMLAADYSQIELRVLAHLSGDVELLDAFRSDADVHVRTACAIYGIAASAVTREMRSRAKTVNFAVIYGQTQFALAKNLRIDRQEAKRTIDAFFARYSGVKRYMDEVLAVAHETGEVRTLLGRRRTIADLHSRNHNLRAAAERAACNMPVQGSSADIIKLAMVAIQGDLEAMSLRSRMVLTVHDELVFEAPPEEEDRLTLLVRERMQKALPLSVPLRVELGWGDDWGAAHG